MTASVTKLAINLRAEMARLAGIKVPARQNKFYFDGDSATVAFTLPNGWKPMHVYSAGLLKRVGTGNDYTITSDSGTWTVTFAVAPAVVFIDIIAEAQL